MATNSNKVMLYRPGMYDVENIHLKERPHIFAGECATIITPDGQIFVIGGKYKCSYTSANLELILDFLVESHPQA
jgi:hypothetical protein